MSEPNGKPATKAELEARNAELEAELNALKVNGVARDVVNASTTENVLPADDPKRPVSIQLFKDGGKYKDDLYIGINNKSWQIQRGVPVTVPFYVAQAIQESMTQDAATAKMIEIKELEFQRLADKGLL